MSFRDDWPTNGDGTEYDGKNLLELVRKSQSPFDGVWDVNQLITEVEEKLNIQVIDIPQVHNGSNNYGLHFVLSDHPAVLVRLARGDVNMPDFDGFPVDVQVMEMRFEAAVYELLRQCPDIKASRLLCYRVPVKYLLPSTSPPKDLAGRRLMVFERAEGENNIWRDLSQRQKSSLLTQAAEIRAALFKFDLPLAFARLWLRERLFEQKPTLLPVAIAPTRDFCIALFTSKVEATIKNEGDMIGWPDDNAVVGPRAAAAKQSILRLIPRILPEEPGEQPVLYRLVLEHGDFGIHNMSIVHDDERVEITSLFDWETGCIVPALLSDTEMALPVDLVLDEGGEAAVARVDEDASPEEVGEWMGWSCHYHHELFDCAPGYEAAVKAGRDARHLRFALKAWRGEDPEGYFDELGEWAENRLNALGGGRSLFGVVEPTWRLQ